MVPISRVYGGGGSRPEGGSRLEGVGVPARGVLRLVWGQSTWEYNEPGPPNDPGPLVFSHETCTPSPDTNLRLANLRSWQPKGPGRTKNTPA